ncbi:MAG: hypothetical protein RR640_02225 [Oscillospiraceae bacterium]
MKKTTLYTIVGFLTACVAIAGAAFAVYKYTEKKKKEKMCFCDDCYDDGLEDFTPECYSDESLDLSEDGGIELDISLDEDNK